MTFKEALKQKEQLGETIIDEGLTMRVAIAPSDSADYAKFIDACRSPHITEDAAKKYSKNGEFVVCAFSTDSSVIIHKVV